MDSFMDLYKKKIKNDGKMTKKQQDILNTCIDLFAEKGFSNTSTSDIAKHADVAEGTIYKHFGTKENLLYATVLPLLMDVVFQKVSKKLESDQKQFSVKSFEELIHNILNDRFQFINENYKMIKIFFMEIIYQEPLRKKLISLVPKELLKEINDLLDYYKQDGQIVDWENNVIIRFILSTLLGYVFTRNSFFPLENWDDKKELQYVEKLIIKGLKS